MDGGADSQHDVITVVFSKAIATPDFQALEGTLGNLLDQVPAQVPAPFDNKHTQAT